MIVSALEIKDSSNRPDDATSLEGVDGVWVKVTAAEGEKCERCWIIDTSVGKNRQHPTLCRRCSNVVEQS